MKAFSFRNLLSLNQQATSTRRRPHSSGASRPVITADVEILEQRSMLSAASALPTVVAIPNGETSISATASTSSHGLGTSQSSVAHPAAPSTSSFVFTATATSSSVVTLNWGPASGATGYYVDIWQNGAWMQIGNVTGTSVNVTGLAAGTTYFFDVGAHNNSATNWGDYKSATTLSNSVHAPSTPTLTATPNSTTQVGLNWSAASGATGYAVDEWVNNNWVQIGTVGAGTTSVNVNGLSANTTYYFSVGASNSVGTTWSSYQTVKTLGGSPVTTVDHPTAGATYTVVSGSLFGSNGPQFTDIHQGNEGDCWLMSSLAAVAARSPSDITSMFTSAGTTVENGQTVNLWKVRFYDSNGTAQYVTVDNELPQGGAYYDHVTGGVLWVALAEKAYAEANGKGYVTTGTPHSDSYDAMDGGWPAWAIQAITGKYCSNVGVNTSNMTSAWNSGQIICLGSSANANNNLIVGGSEGTHAYAVVGYNSSTHQFELYNPWGASSAVNGTISAYGGTVYGGAFWASTSLISQDFSSQDIGTQLTYGANGSSGGSHTLSANGPTDLAVSLPATITLESEFGGVVNHTASKQDAGNNLVNDSANANHGGQSAPETFFATSGQGLDGFSFSLNV